MIEARPEVLRMAELMEKVLRTNDYKGGWDKCAIDWLILKINEEVAELRRAIYEYEYGTDSAGFDSSAEANASRRANVRREGADVANIVMMLLDNMNVL